ncbi:MAG: hypothetical protein U0939_05885 [Pirellulales bacterium]
MHARDLAELAAHLALANDSLQRLPNLLTDEQVQQLEQAHLERQAAWLRAATDWRDDHLQGASRLDSCRRLQKLVDEMTLAEVLQRVLGALADCHVEQGGSTTLVAALVRCRERHAVARERVWTIIKLHGRLPGDVLCGLEVLERSAASWTDLLLAHFNRPHVAIDWSFHSPRMIEFRSDLAHERGLLADRLREDLLLESFRASVRDAAGRVAANPGLNRQIADLVAQAFALPSDRSAIDAPAAPPPRWSQVDIWDRLAAS